MGELVQKGIRDMFFLEIMMFSLTQRGKTTLKDL